MLGFRGGRRELPGREEACPDGEKAECRARDNSRATKVERPDKQDDAQSQQNVRANARLGRTAWSFGSEPIEFPQLKALSNGVQKIAAAKSDTNERATRRDIVAAHSSLPGGHAHEATP
jgi:hypothetical protein